MSKRMKRCWTCPMCAQWVCDVAVLDDQTEVCKRCWRKARGRKTMPWSEFQRLCVVNSSKVPVVEIGGRRRRWVGIGLVDEGPAEGNEVVITP